jgi:hypothetical protein
LNAGGGDHGGNLLSQIVHVAVAAGAEENLLLIRHDSRPSGRTAGQIGGQSLVVISYEIAV